MTANLIKHMQGIRYLICMCSIIILQNWAIDLVGAVLWPSSAQVAVIYYWWLSVIVSPVIETLVFQAFGCWALNLLGCPRRWTLFITAAIFGLVHYQPDNPVLQIINAGVAGLIFSWMYMRRLMEGHPWRGCAEVAFVHIVNNASVYIYSITLAPETIKLMN